MNLRKVKSIISKMSGIMEQSDSMALFMKDSAKQKIEEAMVAQAVSTFLFSQDIYDQAVRFMQAYKKESPEEVCFSNYDISKLAKELQWLRCQKKLFTFLNPCEDLCHTSQNALDTTMDDLELNKRTMRSKRVCAPTPPSQRLRKRAVYDEGSLMDLQHGASIEEDEHNRQSDKENRGEDPASQPGLPTTLRHRFGDGHYDKTGLLGPVLTSHALRFLPGSPSSPPPVRKFTAGSPLPLRERTIDSSLNSPIFFFADLSPKTRAGMTRPKASRESSLESEDFQAEKNRLYDMEVASKSSPFMAI